MCISPPSKNEVKNSTRVYIRKEYKQSTIYIFQMTREGQKISRKDAQEGFL